MRIWLIVAVVIWAVLAGVASAQGEPPTAPPPGTAHYDPDLPTPTPLPEGVTPAHAMGAAAPATVATWLANVRDMPHRQGGSTIVAVLSHGTPVTLTQQLPDRTWVHIEAAGTAGPVAGWMHHTVLHIEPQHLVHVPVATGDYELAGMLHSFGTGATRVPSGRAPVLHGEHAASEAVDVVGEAAPSGVLVTELQGGSVLAPQRRVPSGQETLLELAQRVCYDGNGNRACDVDEGIAGATVYVTEAHTGRLLGKDLTDNTGVALVAVRVAEHARIDVSVPQFGAVRQAGVGESALPPVVIGTQAPLPALLP